MTRENFKQFEENRTYLLSGEMLNKIARAGNAISQGRGGQNAHSLNTTIKTDAPDQLPVMGQFIVRDAGDDCDPDPLDPNGYGKDAPCVDDNGFHRGLYVGAFRYWDSEQNRWLEYPEEVRLDAGGFFEGWWDGANYKSSASDHAGGPGSGAIPLYYPGEVIAAWFDPQRGFAIPMTSSAPQDESHAEYMHQRGNGEIRVPEILPTSYGDTVIARLLTTAPTYALYNNAPTTSQVVDILAWRMPNDDCYQAGAPCYGESSSSSTAGVNVPPGFIDTRTGYVDLVVRHGDAIWMDICRTAEPTGNMYVRDARIRVTGVGRMTAISQGRTYNVGIVDHGYNARDIRYLVRRSTTAGRHADYPVFCVGAPKTDCPDSIGSSSAQREIWIAMPDQNEQFIIRVDWKISIEFEPDPGGLSSTSVQPELSSGSSSSSSTQAQASSISSSTSSSISSSWSSSSSQSSLSSRSQSSQSSLSYSFSSSSSDSPRSLPK